MMIRVADYIADFLVKAGADNCFSVVGGGAMHLNDALGHKQGLHVIYNHHEQACAMAAEAYARLSGKIAPICVTSGPGGTNAITGVLGGWLDSIPMLVLSGQVKFVTTIKSTDVPLRQLGDQEFNITDCVRHLTKYAVMVTDPLKIAYHLEKALFLAKHGRPGPVWLDIPLNVQGAKVEEDELLHYDPAEDADALPPDPNTDDLKLLLEKVRNAKRPVILAGAGIRTGGAYEEFLQIIDKLGIPVVTAWNAHDLLWDSNPLYCGRPGTVGTRGGNFVVQNSDLLISLACRMNIRQISYEWQNFAKDAYKIAVDIDEGELKKPTLSIDLPIHADIKVVLDMLLQLIGDEKMPSHDSWLKWCRDIDAKYPAVLPEYEKDGSAINPYVFMETLSERLQDGDVIACGNGSACVCSFQAMHVRPQQRLFTNSGCASMGYGLPAALGSAVAMGGQRVICLDGDGSIQMNIQELQTVVYNNLNIKLFWLNNDGYHSIRQTQTNNFNSNYCGISEGNGVSFPDAERIAYAYEIPFFRISSPLRLISSIDKVLQAPGCILCEVVIDKEQFFSPKLSSKVLEDGSIVSPTLEDMYPFLSEEEMRKNRLS